MLEPLHKDKMPLLLHGNGVPILLTISRFEPIESLLVRERIPQMTELPGLWLKKFSSIALQSGAGRNFTPLQPTVGISHGDFSLVWLPQSIPFHIQSLWRVYKTECLESWFYLGGLWSLRWGFIHWPADGTLMAVVTRLYREKAYPPPIVLRCCSLPLFRDEEIMSWLDEAESHVHKKLPVII